MKTAFAVLTAAFLVIGGGAMAQSNATIQGTQTAPGNASGTPNAASPTGQMGTSTVTTGTPPSPGDVAANQPAAPATGSATTTPNAPAATK